MTFKEDIIKRINADFGEQSNQATKTLVDAVARVDYLKTERIIRCILYLAKGDMTNLNKYIDTAIFDPRDVMLWAEYEKLNSDFKYKRLRDFNKTFEECSTDVNE